MIRRLLAWLGITRTGVVIQPTTWRGRTIWDWQCLECRSGVGCAASYEVARLDAGIHTRTQHGEVTA